MKTAPGDDQPMDMNLIATIHIPALPMTDVAMITKAIPKILIVPEIDQEAIKDIGLTMIEEIIEVIAMMTIVEATTEDMKVQEENTETMIDTIETEVIEENIPQKEENTMPLLKITECQKMIDTLKMIAIPNKIAAIKKATITKTIATKMTDTEEKEIDTEMTTKITRRTTLTGENNMEPENKEEVKEKIAKTIKTSKDHLFPSQEWIEFDDSNNSGHIYSKNQLRLAIKLIKLILIDYCS